MAKRREHSARSEHPPHVREPKAHSRRQKVVWGREDLKQAAISERECSGALLRQPEEVDAGPAAVQHVKVSAAEDELVRRCFVTVVEVEREFQNREIQAVAESRRPNRSSMAAAEAGSVLTGAPHLRNCQIRPQIPVYPPPAQW